MKNSNSHIPDTFEFNETQILNPKTICIHRVNIEDIQFKMKKK